MIVAALLACAANIAPVTLEAVIGVESHGNPLALHVNHHLGPQPRPASVAEAAEVAERYIRRGFSVDLGLMQVNASNLPVLGYTVAEALDPCTNIRAGSTILTADYAEAARTRGEGQAALQAALSAYNTGDFVRGFRNGYVALYYAPGGDPRWRVPALAGGVRQATATAAAAKRAAPAPPPNPYTADMRVYSREVMDVVIQ